MLGAERRANIHGRCHLCSSFSGIKDQWLWSLPRCIYIYFSKIGTCRKSFPLNLLIFWSPHLACDIDPLVEITKEGDYMNSLEEPFKDVYAALEVYHASQIMHQEELAFGEENVRSIDFLKRKISTASIPSNRHSKFIHKEVFKIWLWLVVISHQVYYQSVLFSCLM